MSVKSSVLVVLLLLVAVSAPAEWILIPSSAAELLPGAEGSLWSVRLTAYNKSPFFIRIDPPEECNLAPCEQKLLAPGEAIEVSLGRRVPNGLGEYFVISPSAEHLDFYYRTRDESRRLETAGTMLPILRETEAPTGDVNLVGIPIEGRFRVMLRLYGISGPEIVEVRLYPVTGGGALASKSIVLSPIGLPEWAPAQAQIADLGSMIPGFTGEIRIHVDAGEQSSVWGFATVTHNDTQHVTVVEAQ